MTRLSLVVLLTYLLAACASAPYTPTPAVVADAAPAGQLLGLDMLDFPETAAPYDLAKDSGARWIRFPFRWKEIQRSGEDPAFYKWDSYDKVFSSLKARGLRVMLTVRDNPAWAADTACGPLNEAGMAAFAQWLDAAVRRYSTEEYDIHHWELYNEPDNQAIEFHSQGGCWGNEPAAYAEMLKLFHDTIKAADPEAIVIFGGLALEKMDGDPFNIDFLEQVLEAGGGDHFDWMNYHYYPAFSYRWDRFGAGIEGKANYVRSELEKAGIDRPLICSEVGQPNAGPEDEGYSDEKTTALLYRELARAMSADLEIVIWHKLVDRTNDTRLYGLVAPDLTLKPAFTTYQTLATALANARFAGALTAEESGSSKIEGYRFVLDEGPYSTLLIAWSSDEKSATEMALPARKASVTDVAGQETIHEAGAPVIHLSSSPLLIRY